MKVFLIAVGGTGINCLQSYLYVNAISSNGFDEDVDYEVLFVDPDSTGSYTDLVESIAGYGALKKAIDTEKEKLKKQEKKKSKSKKSAPKENTDKSDKKKKKNDVKVKVEQFSANFAINDKWTIATQLDRKLIELCETNNIGPDNATEEDLLQVFYQKKYLNMNFSGGFHGVPNVGTLVTKHFMDRDGSSWRDFLDKIKNETQETHIVILGSIFGGTGAAGIPALMNKLMEERAYEKAKLHVLMMLPYFELPNVEEVKKLGKDKVKYGLGNMNLNSAYALEYYESLDSDILEKFSFIMVGQPQKDLIKKEDYTESGKEQKNKAMIAELVASFLIIHSIKESRTLSETEDDRARLIMSTFNTEDAENGFVDFDGIPYTDGFVKKIAAMKFLAEIFINKLEEIFKRTESDRTTEETYVFEQRLKEIDENQVRYAANFFKNFIQWSKSINFVNIKGKEELFDILYSYTTEGKKEPVYKFKPNSEDTTEDIFEFYDFVDFITGYIRKHDISGIGFLLLEFVNLIIPNAVNPGMMFVSTSAFLYKLITYIQERKEKEEK